MKSIPTPVVRCPSCGADDEVVLRMRDVTVDRCHVSFDPQDGARPEKIGDGFSWDEDTWCVCDECEFGAPFKTFQLDKLPGRFEVLVVAYDMQERITVTADTPEVAKRLAVQLVEKSLDQVDILIAGQVVAESVRLVYVSPDAMRESGIAAALIDGAMQSA